MTNNNEFSVWDEILSWFSPIKFVSNLNKYNFGEPLPTNYQNVFEAFKKFIKEKGLSLDEVAFEPVYAYIHGNIVLDTKPFNDKWDSGIAGYIWVEKKEYSKLLGYKRFSKNPRKNFKNEVDNLIKSLNGWENLEAV